MIGEVLEALENVLEIRRDIRKQAESIEYDRGYFLVREYQQQEHAEIALDEALKKYLRAALA